MPETFVLPLHHWSIIKFVFILFLGWLVNVFLFHLIIILFICRMFFPNFANYFFGIFSDCISANEKKRKPILLWFPLLTGIYVLFSSGARLLLMPFLQTFRYRDFLRFLRTTFLLRSYRLPKVLLVPMYMLLGRGRIHLRWRL